MDTYFSNVTLFDGNAVKRRAGVLVSGGSIQWVGSHTRAPREAKGAAQVDGSGRVLTPGLIDCHVHLCFDGEADFVAEADASEAYAAVKCVRNAERHLASGVTTVRDLGGLGAVACEVAKAIDDGRVRGPRVMASGQALTITGGHGWNTIGRQVDGRDGVRAGVREQIRSGARSIKIIATGGVLTPGIPVDFTAFTPEEIDAAVDEARKWGVPIAAHAIGATGIDHCVAAGVDSIEHGSEISPRTATRMKDRGVFQVPTINALRGIVDHPEDVPSYAVEKGRRILDLARDSFQRVMRSGASQASGTDAGTPHNPHGSLPLEIVRMVEWGLPPLKALQAATVNAARLLRVGAAGAVEEGKIGDLVLYPDDPLDDPAALLAPELVMKGGERVERLP